MFSCINSSANCTAPSLALSSSCALCAASSAPLLSPAAKRQRPSDTQAAEPVAGVAGYCARACSATSPPNPLSPAPPLRPPRRLPGPLPDHGLAAGTPEHPGQGSQRGQFVAGRGFRQLLAQQLGPL